MLPIPADEARILPQIELLHGLSDVVEEQLKLLLPVEEAWQPSDFLPDLTADDWQEQTARFREQTVQLTDEVLVVLVGDMVTEEALPNYAISLNLIARDYVGTSTNPWARWMRGWTAEENRHGDLLNAFLRLTGRVDMRSVELTIHHLISSGFDPRSRQDPYAGLIYTSFQERATKVSHANVGRMAGRNGDENLVRICQKIAGDESRHEQFYTRMMGEVMDRDPDRGVLIFRDMMRHLIAMPGRLMSDGCEGDLFERFAIVAQRLGVYTVHDYADIVRHLVDRWGVADRSLAGSAAAAQEFLCLQADRLDSIADNVTEKAIRQPPSRFSWIKDRLA